MDNRPKDWKTRETFHYTDADSGSTFYYEKGKHKKTKFKDGEEHLFDDDGKWFFTFKNDGTFLSKPTRGLDEYGFDEPEERTIIIER